MPVPCERNVRETRRGAGRCDISFDMLKRSGRPNWWCSTHGMEASAPDGTALPSCPGAWFDAVPADMQLDIDLADGEYAIWGVVPPALQVGRPPLEPGKVHVHRRPTAAEPKDIDRSYDLVTVRNGDRQLEIEGTAAVAFSVSELAGQRLTALRCPRCGELHIDERRFATWPHRRHLCNGCGHPFNDASGPSISNPLANAHALLELPSPPRPQPIDRPIELERARYTAIALWPSNSAILSTMTRPEESGIHIHAWGHDRALVIDDTHSPVVLDGQVLDEEHLRRLAVQRVLAHGAPVTSLACSGCGSPLLSPAEGWIDPTTTHTCTSCGSTTKTRRRSFLNPLAEKS